MLLEMHFYTPTARSRVPGPLREPSLCKSGPRPDRTQKLSKRLCNTHQESVVVVVVFFVVVVVSVLVVVIVVVVIRTIDT